MASHETPDDIDSEPEIVGEEEDMLAEEDMLEEVGNGEEDVAMDSDDEPEEVQLQNDSIAYFDQHKDSIFAIAQHPRYPNIIATGGSEGDADDAPGKGYVIDASAANSRSRPVLPASYNADPAASAATAQTTALPALSSIDGHSDSINALTFTLPNGDFMVSGGLDGRLRVYDVSVPNNYTAGSSGAAVPKFKFLAESQEVPEINWLLPCPSPMYPNTVALGASDGSVWVYTIDPSDVSDPLQIIQSYFLHTGPSTAGAWTPDGLLLATVSEDSSLHVWDVWGVAATKGLAGNTSGMTVVSLTAADQRFSVEGGLYSVAVEPRGAFLATGGAGGAIKIVGLPRLSEPQGHAASATISQSQPGRPRPGRAAGGGSAAQAQAAQAGAILASLHAQGDSIETLSFAPAPQTLLAAGSVDGSVTVYDTSRSFSVRRNVAVAHDDFSVVKVEFVRGGPGAGWLLTSCGMDGVVRRWDLRDGSATAAAAEWRGHRGEGEGGGVLGFVQGEDGERIVTAGDDGVVLVFEA